jgi:aspartyl-tRNA(Asn)/glutamyl-tRNA(Gln) amidotransferase subunit A
MASSLDQAGPICKTAEDTEILYNVIRGKDGFDGTLLEYPKEESKFDIKKLKIGYVTDIWKNKESLECPEKYQAVFDFFKSQGAQIKEVSIKNLDLVLPTYYIIVPAEVASNLARYDGVKYTKAAKDCDNINDLYKRTRGELLGSEVKRRIMTGNYVLSSGYFDAYYNKAKKVQAALKQSFLDVFKECDIIITPTATGEAIKLGEKQDPVSMYLMDIFTVPANITGIPAMNVPFAVGKSGMPLGIQIMGKHFSEKLIFETAKYYEAHNGGKK